MSQPFRLAIVGAGMISQVSHLPAALASPLVKVSAIVDPAVERAAGLAQSYGLSVHVAPRIEDVLTEIDGAIIATPNDSHSSIAVACLRHGVSVLIEKPLASSYAEGIEIVRAAEETGRVAAVGYATRFRDEIVLLKELLDEGYFGDVTRFAYQFGTRGGWAPFSAYNLNRKSAGGGVLVVTGTHFIDRMLYFWGYPDEAMLEDDSLGGPEAHCTARFAYVRDGRRFEGATRYSKTVQLPAGLVIATDRGTIILKDQDNADIVFRDNRHPSIDQIVRRRNAPAVPEERSMFQLQIEDFVEACVLKRPPRVSDRQGLESLRLLEQLYANRETSEPDWYGATAGIAA
jgi:predicted dehydrogenase